MDRRAISFGPFRLLAEQRLLLEGDRPVRLGSRAFDILVALVERAGEVVGKEELIARVWPRTFVEEANLKIQVSALRRALGDGQDGRRYVITVPGRGYSFIATTSLEQAPLAAPSLATNVRHNLPHAVNRVVGREEAIATLVSRVSRQRLVTVVGPGGVGKTTVALAVAERMIPAFEHGVWLADLAPLSDPRLVATTVAAALGLEVRAGDPVPSLLAGLKNRRMLLLLDNCEHVIEDAAGVAAAILGGARDVNILATSREPLRVAEEREYRLRSLGRPVSINVTLAEAAPFPAVQLFVERATAVAEDFALTQANASLVAEICRRLDGLPLAIELAAPGVAMLGVNGLAAHLGGNLPRLGPHRRALVPRHRTMRAVVDWSYNLLTKDEQLIFQSLGIFAGGFTVEAAAVVVFDAGGTPSDAIDRLADLVTKSLVVTDVSGANPRFRLLNTTRIYAIEKLGESERDRLARRHAEYYRDLFKSAEGAAAARPPSEWLASAAEEIDNVRAALDWSSSSPLRVTIGVELAAAYVPVWMNLPLAGECRERCERALLELEAARISDTRLQMQLQIGLGNSLLRTLGPSEQAQKLLTEALAIADALGDLRAQLRILLALSSVNVYRGEYARGTAEVERAAEIAHRLGDIPTLAVVERRMGTSLLTAGKLGEAQRWLERAIRSLLHLEQRSVEAHSRERAMARAMLARTLWLQGFPDTGRREALASLDDVQGPDRQLTMCRVLYYGIGRIAPMTGDFGAAERAVSTLVELATQVDAPFWITAGQLLRGKLLVQRGEYAQGLAVLRDAFDICRRTGWRLSYPEFTGSLALALAGLGRLGEAYDAVAGAIESAGGHEDGQQWYVPELLRIQGEVLLQQDAERVLIAESRLDQAATMAREQGALFWELRIGLSLCRLNMARGRSDEGRRQLASLYARFTEGSETSDLVLARQLLDQ
jgi:predicted ATPase/DNA-binding winged helix-turn-helix (wHTH) protein